VARAAFQLTKPRIIELLLVTTIPTMLLAHRGLPSLKVFFVTLIGGAFAAGSANTLNCYLDRDIDAVMRRTAHRPLAAAPGQGGSIKPHEALASGIALGVAALLLLGLLVNWLAAFLATGAILFYVFVYTLGLKRRTASNIVIGGAAGCFPVLVGWAAVTGTVAWPAAALFAIIFLWTPPHFWALAMRFRDDYAAASVPMLPVVATAQVVARKILGYSYAMVAATLALAPAAGWVYAVCAAPLGAWFLAEAHRLRAQIAATFPAPERHPAVLSAPERHPTAVLSAPERHPTVLSAPERHPTVLSAPERHPTAGSASAVSPAPMRLFHLSIAYLTLLFAVIAVTALLPWGRW
jgi:protoheme IX farnesyltransferase